MAPICAIVVSAIAPFAIFAQDTRTVVEPKIPLACTVLTAEKLSQGDSLPAEFEKTLDTARIQQAMDQCKSGEAVELAPRAAKGASPAGNAFLSGPLDLRDGVTLLVDRGVTLFGSRDPRDYDPNPAQPLCGSMSAAPASPNPAANAAPPGRGCKPLISAVNVKNAAIMGDGIIDGRGNVTSSGAITAGGRWCVRDQPITCGLSIHD